MLIRETFRTGSGYIRYSSIMQEDGFSLDAQEREIRRRAEHDGVKIVSIYSDPVQSAYRKRFRPGIEAMLAAAQRGEFQILYVHKLDRLARRVEWSIEIARKLREAGVLLVSVEQNFDIKTPEGKLFFHLFCSLGEFYSDNLSKETHKGKYERAMQGYHNGWTTWGYTSETIQNRKTAVPDPELMSVVLSLFERYATALYSDQQSADWLNEQGYRTRHGRLFSKDSLREILQNPFYAGFIRYRGQFIAGQPYRDKNDLVPGVHTPIISWELFEKCQAVRRQRHRTVKTRQHTRHPFYFRGGLLKCAHCGRALRAQSGKRRYYREASKFNGFDCPMIGKSVPADLVEGQIEGLIQQMVLPEDWQQALQAFLKEEAPNVPDPEQEKGRLTKELRRLRQNYEMGMYEEDMHVYRRKVEALQAQLQTLKDTPPSQAVDAAHTVLSLQKAWDFATEEERDELVHMLFMSVVCDLERGQLVSFMPRPEFIIIFQIMPALAQDEAGQFLFSEIP